MHIAAAAAVFVSSFSDLCSRARVGAGAGGSDAGDPIRLPQNYFERSLHRSASPLRPQSTIHCRKSYSEESVKEKWGGRKEGGKEGRKAVVAPPAPATSPGPAWPPPLAWLPPRSENGGCGGNLMSAVTYKNDCRRTNEQR